MMTLYPPLAGRKDCEATRDLLKNVFSEVPAKQMTAIMGPRCVCCFLCEWPELWIKPDLTCCSVSAFLRRSGAGKASLLSILA
jgi:hypothetical protein